MTLYLLPRPRHRTVTIELDGLLQYLPAEYHPAGPLVGRLVTTPASTSNARSANAQCRWPCPCTAPPLAPTHG
jgi:hypothetical protein